MDYEQQRTKMEQQVAGLKWPEASEQYIWSNRLLMIIRDVEKRLAGSAYHSTRNSDPTRGNIVLMTTNQLEVLCTGYSRY